MTDRANPVFTLDRRQAVPALIGDQRDFLIVAGLAGTARDLAALCDDGPQLFTLAGAMGGAVAAGLGLALAQPRRQVLTVTGDGDLLMSLGSLATVAVMNPPNLTVVCVDNGHYGETGNQLSHTGHGVELAQIATGAGIGTVISVEREEQLAPAAQLLRANRNGCCFVLLRVKPGDPPVYKRRLDAAACRLRFRANLSLP